jgi:hypothetical protein
MGVFGTSPSTEPRTDGYLRGQIFNRPEEEPGKYLLIKTTFESIMPLGTWGGTAEFLQPNTGDVGWRFRNIPATFSDFDVNTGIQIADPDEIIYNGLDDPLNTDGWNYKSFSDDLRNASFFSRISLTRLKKEATGRRYAVVTFSNQLAVIEESPPTQIYYTGDTSIQITAREPVKETAIEPPYRTYTGRHEPDRYSSRAIRKIGYAANVPHYWIYPTAGTGVGGSSYHYYSRTFEIDLRSNYATRLIPNGELPPNNIVYSFYLFPAPVFFAA